MKRVLVTGASGFIGRQVLAPLLASGYEVHAVARRCAPSAGIAWHCADLLEPGSAYRLLDAVRPSHLLHLAWYAEHGKFWSATENYAWVGATLELLRAFADAGGRRAVAAGTCAEYDVRYGYCDESITPTAPANDYGVCKNAMRALFDAYCARRGVSGAWGRLFHLYGPHEHPARLVASVARSLLQDEDAACSHGRQLRDFLHVADSAAALVALLDSDVTGAVNIGSGQAVSIGEVARRLALLAGRPQRLQLGARPAPAGEPPVLIAATRRLHEEVGWRSRHGLDAGLQLTLDWWRNELKSPA